MRIQQILDFEKRNMNRIRYIMNYRIVPGYLFSCAICLVIICVMMSIDETKYTLPAIFLFIIIGLLSALLLAAGPFVRKKEIQIEMSRYDFEKKEIDSVGIYEFMDEGKSIHFDSSGMTVDDSFFWYNHLKVRINTSNYLNRVLITVAFFINEEEHFEVPLNGDTIDMIRRFGIKLENPDALEYIVHHKEDAFNKIYKTGHA